MTNSREERIGIIGAGRLGSALGRALVRAGVAVEFCLDVDGDRASRLASALTGCQAIASLDAVTASPTLVLVTVPDRFIAPVMAQLAQSPLNRDGAVFVHCSGLWPSVVGEWDGPALRASFHPVMLFTGSERMAFNGVPVALEGDAAALARLEALALRLGARPLRIESEAKAAYHAACALASNLWIGLLDATDEVARSVFPGQGIGWLLPLIRATLDEVESRGVAPALTGPVVRGDAATVARHVQALAEGHPQVLEIYRVLSRRLLDMAQTRGLGPEESDAIRKVLD